jgi:hypothetical protein
MVMMILIMMMIGVMVVDAADLSFGGVQVGGGAAVDPGQREGQRLVPRQQHHLLHRARDGKTADEDTDTESTIFGHDYDILDELVIVSSRL